MLLRFIWGLVRFEAVLIHVLCSTPNPSSRKLPPHSEILFISVTPDVCANQFSSCQFLFINNATERIEILPDFNLFFSCLNNESSKRWILILSSATQRTRYDQKFAWLLPTLCELRRAIRTANCHCTCADNLHFHCSLFYVISYSWDEYLIQQLIYKTFALNNNVPFLL